MAGTLAVTAYDSRPVERFMICRPQYSDTIVALSTPRDYSGIGVIRISGPDAIPIVSRVFKPAKGGLDLPDRRAVALA